MTDPAAPPAEAPSEAPVGAPPDPAGEAPPPEAPKRPALGELHEYAARMKTERETSEAADTDARELAEYRAMKADGRLEQPAKTPADERRMVAIDELLADPQALRRVIGDDAKFRAYLSTSAKAVTDPDIVGIGQRLEELSAKPPEGVEELKAQVAELQQERQQANASRRERAFVETSESMDGEAQAYPFLSRLPESERVARAHGAIAEYQQAGVDISDMTNNELSTILEDSLRAHYELLSGAPNQADPSAPTTARPAGGATRPQTTRKGRRSLTNDLAAEGSRSPRPLTDAERENRTLALMREQRSLHAG